MHNLNHTYNLCTTLPVPVEEDDLEWSNSMLAILFLAVKTMCSSVLVSVTMLQSIGSVQCTFVHCVATCVQCVGVCV